MVLFCALAPAREFVIIGDCVKLTIERLFLIIYMGSRARPSEVNFTYCVLCKTHSRRNALIYLYAPARRASKSAHFQGFSRCVREWRTGRSTKRGSLTKPPGCDIITAESSPCSRKFVDHLPAKLEPPCNANTRWFVLYLPFPYLSSMVMSNPIPVRMRYRISNVLMGITYLCNRR